MDQGRASQAFRELGSNPDRRVTDHVPDLSQVREAEEQSLLHQSAAMDIRKTEILTKEVLCMCAPVQIPAFGID